MDATTADRRDEAVFAEIAALEKAIANRLTQETARPLPTDVQNAIAYVEKLRVRAAASIGRSMAATGGDRV